MRKIIQDAIAIVAIAACAACLLSASPARAATDGVATATAAGSATGPTSDDALYRALGEKAGIAALMKDFAARLKTDARVAAFFKDSKEQFIASQLTDQVCGLSGGPCAYDGASMKDAHRDLGIARADFNALVEVLQDAMDSRQLPTGTQNRLLARLAPMHRDVVTK